jgi:putative transposase
MIRDRGPDFTAALEAVLADTGDPDCALQRADAPHTAIAERWIAGCRRELLARILIWSQNHLRQILRQYETNHNQHRPHRSLRAAAPLKPLPEPVDLEQYRVRRQARAHDPTGEYRLVASRG